MSIDPTQPATPDDAAITRSEEELTVTTQWTPTGRVRIFKRTTTVTETRTYELIREELVVEQLDGDLTDGAPSDRRPVPVPVSLVLQREELEVTRRLVPYERVEVHIDLITEQHTVDATLRKERVVADGDIRDAPSPARTDHV